MMNAVSSKVQFIYYFRHGKNFATSEIMLPQVSYSFRSNAFYYCSFIITWALPAFRIFSSVTIIYTTDFIVISNTEGLVTKEYLVIFLLWYSLKVYCRCASYAYHNACF